MIKRKECYVCRQQFYTFGKYREGGHNPEAAFMNRLQMIGSDPENFLCFYCHSHDRERHLYMYFDKIDFWSRMKSARILHFAPEKNLGDKIAGLATSEYVRADLYPKDNVTVKVDLLAMHFANDYFDILICNHVLEHVNDFQQAMNEIRRVLKPGGVAIIQTPFSRLLKENFEDTAIQSDADRLFFYGQEDHARVFSEARFLSDVSATGFDLQLQKHSSLFKPSDAYYYGVNANEDLIMIARR